MKNRDITQRPAVKTCKRDFNRWPQLLYQHPCELHSDMVRIGSITGRIEALEQDLRYAARGMSKSPAFTLVAVLTLALGIGGTTTIFSALDALLLRPLPYPDQNRLVAISNSYRQFPRDRGPVSSTDVAHWRADNQVFEQIESVSRPDMVAMSSAGSAERVGVQHVSMRLFSLLGIKSFLGSPFRRQSCSAISWITVAARTTAVNLRRMEPVNSRKYNCTSRIAFGVVPSFSSSSTSPTTSSGSTTRSIVQVQTNRQFRLTRSCGPAGATRVEN